MALLLDIFDTAIGLAALLALAIIGSLRGELPERPGGSPR
jgi:hypothetical protein